MLKVLRDPEKVHSPGMLATMATTRVKVEVAWWWEVSRYNYSSADTHRET